MSEASLEQLSPSTLKIDILKAVASEEFDIVLDDLSDAARFVISCTRAAARRQELVQLCAFVHSDAAKADTGELGFTRVAHMQDGYGELSGALVATNREANNGMLRPLQEAEPAKIMDEIEELGLGNRCAVLWDPSERVATVYPSGTENCDEFIRQAIPFGDSDLTQDEVCAALDEAHQEHLCNPSGHTIKLWTKNGLTSRAEDAIERHLKGQLHFALGGKQRGIKIWPQTQTTAGRFDLLLLQSSSIDAPRRPVGVLELKVLRGPLNKDQGVTKEGLSQGFHYRKTDNIPFATLALFDVASPPSNDTTPLLENQNPDHLKEVRVRRFPIYNSPQAWRNAGGAQEEAA